MIHVAHLSKVFHSPAPWSQILRGRLRGQPIRALDDVTFDVAEGEIVGLCGPNGAGKSTLLRILAGIVLPTLGTVRVLGVDAAQQDARHRARVGYAVSDERSFSWRLSGRQNLEFFAALHGLGLRQARDRVSQLINLLGVREYADRPFREYSSGMRQRFVLARGLLGDPSLLLLDEPTRGLDPRAAVSLASFICNTLARPHKKTILCATHDMGLLRAFCDRVLVLEAGRIVATTTPDKVAEVLGVER